MSTNSVSSFLPCRFGAGVCGCLEALCARLVHGSLSLPVSGPFTQATRAELSLALYGLLAKDGVDSFASWDVLQELEALDDIARRAPLPVSLRARRTLLAALVPPCGSPSEEMLRFLGSLGPNGLTHRQARSIIGECAAKLASPME